MLRLDINLVFTIINLLIWYAIIRIFLFKPINKVIDNRSAAIQEKYDEAKKMQEEAQAEKEKYAACQDEIEVEKNKVLDAARASAREEGRQLIENAQKEADKVIRQFAFHDFVVEYKTSIQFRDVFFHNSCLLSGFMSAIL